MPDSTAPRPSGTVPRIAGLALVLVGAAGLIASAFLTWFTMTVRLPDAAATLGLPAEITAKITGLGRVTLPEVNGHDLSSSVHSDVMWGGTTAIVIAVAAVLTSTAAAFGAAGLRSIAACADVAFGAAGVALGIYALAVPEVRKVSAQGFTMRAEQVAAIGPHVVIGAAAAVLIGAIVLFFARRSALPAAAPSAHVPAPPAPAPPFAPGAQQMPQAGYAPSNPPAQTPDTAWARPVAPAMPAPVPPPVPTPAPVPEAQTRTAVAPVAQRRPQPDWDRNWPATVPPKPAPARPSEQQTQIVKRPPRPVKVSPKPETEAIPRRDPRFDSPTEPL